MGNIRSRAGDYVQVRTREEILRTLDASGCVDKLPFMPEMLAFCGRTFRVASVAHKTCDTVHSTGGRRMQHAVHLEDARCDGAAHGGCQAACLLFWKTAWVKPVSVDQIPPTTHTPPHVCIDDAVLYKHARALDDDGQERFSCQATALYDATAPLPWWDIRQYFADVRTRNVTLGYALATLLLAAIRDFGFLSLGYRLRMSLYSRLHSWLRGRPDPHGVGRIPKGRPTPDRRLDLQVGEYVRIRGRDEILETVNNENRNRGLNVDEEMMRYCGGRYPVASRVTHIINEKSGKMMSFQNPCIVLEGVHCLGEYTQSRLFCPRRITAYWREIWLERV